MPSIRRLSQRLGVFLPTAHMVDLVYEAASVKLEPQPMKPGPRMRSTEYYLEHDRRIESALDLDQHRGELIGGHKKDIVISRRLRTMRDRIAIYGWHRSNGQPIQPLSTVHGATYADYSHGVRWVCAQVRIGGDWRDLNSILASADESQLLSDRGPIQVRSLMRPQSPGQ